MAAPKRLSKVARELNVGISTIVEFLSEQGKDIDTSPNTKLDTDVYELLLGEFQADKGAKVKADEASRQITEERKTITIDRTDEEVAGETTETIAPSEKLSGPSVVGKIDLDKVETSARPAKKENKSEAKPEKPVETVKQEVKEEVKDPESDAEKPVETIKAQTKKLTGPTVLGKIELPVEKEKPKADSEAQKRKRKRIKKVNIEKTGANVAKQVRKTTRKDQQKNEVSQEEIQKK